MKVYNTFDFWVRQTKEEIEKWIVDNMFSLHVVKIKDAGNINFNKVSVYMLEPRDLSILPITSRECFKSMKNLYYFIDNLEDK